METLFVGKNFVEVPAIDSTNSFANQLLDTRPPEGTLIYTPHQFAGRGQQNSTWVSEPGDNLTFSIVLYPRFLPPERLFALNKIASLALLETLRPLFPPDHLHIKWPNDLLVQRRKTAGILIENQLESSGIRAAVLGIGLNVNQVEFPPDFAGRTTSIKAETGQSHDPKALLAAFCQHLEGLYLQLRAGQTDRMDRAYLQHLFAYQELTPVEIDGQDRQVMIVGVDAQGRLAIEQGGQLRYCQMKEIRFRL